MSDLHNETSSLPGGEADVPGPGLAEHMLTRRRLGALALIGAGALVTAACGGSSSSSKASRTAAAGPATLTFWVKDPFPNPDIVLGLWKKLHPEIDVKFNVVATNGNTIPQAQLLLDIKAGKTPDVAMFDFQYLPQFVTTGSVLDLNTIKGGNAASLASSYQPWAWSTVHVGDGLYGLPNDSGPLSMFYRKDLFEKYNIAVPTSMDEFVQAAEKLHSDHPDTYLMDFPTNDASPFIALAWAAGARPFATKGNSWVVNIADDASMRVATMLQGLLDKKAILTLPQFSSQWSQYYNTGKLISWFSAAWAPGPLASFAPKTAGKWAVAALPQWNPGTPSSGNWGGSTTAVFKSTKYPAQALEFIKFLTTNTDLWSQYWVPKISVYPTSVAAAKIPVLNEPSKFFGGQKIYDTIAASSQSVTNDFSFGPVANYWFTTLQNNMQEAVNGKIKMTQALQATQTAVVTYIRSQGLSVEAS